jgi:hypothetical protein
VVTSGLSFWRTSELGESAAVYDELTEARKEAPEDLVISGSFFQESKEAKLYGMLKRVAGIAAPALTATGLLVAGFTALPVVMLAGGLALLTALTAKEQGPAIKTALEDYKLARKYQEYEGLNVWREGGEATEVNVEATSSPQAGTREMLVSNMRDFPNSFHVVHANGHGLGSRYTAGLPTQQWAEALGDASEKAQNDVDVAVLDTCFGASFEAVSRLGQRRPHGVKFVVAFEDAIPNANSSGGRIPLKSMLTEALDQTTARDIAVSMAQTAAKHFNKPNNQPISEVPLTERLNPETLEKRRQGLDSTVVAIDVETLQSKLHPALDKAGAQLRKAMGDPAMATAIQQAKEASEIEPTHDLVDLGGFLTRILKTAPEGSALQSSLKEALTSLDATLMFKRTGHKYPLSGLSIHTRDKAGGSSRFGEISPLPTRPLDGDHLPKGWVEFIKEAF